MKSFILFSMLFMDVAANVFAGEHEASHAGINWWGIGSQYRDNPALGWYSLTFFIFVFGLIYFIRKPLSLYLEVRSNDIRKAINEAQIAKEEASAKLKAYEDRLEQLDQEIKKMKEEFAKQGMLEKEQLKQAAQQLAAQIAKDTDEMIVADRQNAIYQLKQEMVEKVITLVKEDIQNHTNQQIENRLKNEFVQDVGQLMH